MVGLFCGMASERAEAGDEASLEDLFLKAVGAESESEGRLSWLG